MDTNTQWERVEVGPDTAKALQWGIYAIWSCLRDGRHIFRVEHCGTTPSSNDGGYFSIVSALRQKGFR